MTLLDDQVATAPEYCANYIGGEWRPGRCGRTLRVTDPFTHDVVATFAIANTLDVDDAYRAAAAAQPAWASAAPPLRREIFVRAERWVHEHHDEVRDLIVRELGGTLLRAELEIALVADTLRGAAELTAAPAGELLASPDPEKENRLYHRPVGVVGVISPFNVPLFLSLKPVAPALALGNAVVLKPHELAPVTGGTLIARMFEECGLPPGLLNVVVSDIDALGDAFVEHPIPEVIAFTGSSATGRHIAEVAGRGLKRVVLELGGNSALVVLDDADVDLAVNAAAFSRFTHAGQVCLSANRIVVDAQLHDAFVERFVDKARGLVVGDPRDPRTVIGPMISVQQCATLERQIDDAVAHGAKLALAAAPRDEGSCLCGPTVLTDVTVDNPVSQVELFGPAVCIMRARDEADAVRIANATPYGLSGAVHTTDLERGVRMAMQIRTGMVHVNNATIADEVAVPFGGVGASGYGRLNGAASVRAFTTTRWLSVHHGTPRFPY